MPIVMQSWHPDQIVALLDEHAFMKTGRWGSYTGAGFSEGSEFVVRFRE